MERVRAISSGFLAAVLLVGCANSVALTADVVPASQPTDPRPIESLPSRSAQPGQPTAQLADQFLLPTEAMPSWPGNTGWTEAGNIPLDFDSCSLPDLMAFGGLGVLSRSYTGAGDLAGIHLVGDFGDPASAATANVLVADRLRDCPNVAPLTSFISGSTWVLRTPGNGVTTVAYFAVDYVGRYLTLVAFRTSIAGAPAPGDPIAATLATATGQLPPRQG